MANGPKPLTAEAIQRDLRTSTIGRALQVLAAVPSTNDMVMVAAEAGAPSGFCVVADCQTAGRGRRGRGWNSAPGLGLYASILVRPDIPAAQVPLITLAAGLAVVDAARDVTGGAPALKWPNDVLLAGRKVAGILSEAAASGSRISHAVVGVGINVHHALPDFPQELRTTATSLGLATGKRVDRAELAAALLNAFEQWYGRLETDGPQPVLDAARHCSATLGAHVQVQAAVAWEGVALDLDDDGALLVRDTAGRVRRVLAEDVSIRAAMRHSRDTGP